MSLICALFIAEFVLLVLGAYDGTNDGEDREEVGLP